MGDLQQYEAIKFQRTTEAMVLACEGVIEDFQAQGLRLTLRQLYYQLVISNTIPNTVKTYKRLGAAVSKARMTGRLPWNALEDRVRQVKRPSEWNTLRDLVESALYSYRLPRLRGQAVYPELWCEKDALAGVLSPVSREYHVPLMINRGYSSSSAMWESAGRIDSRCRDQEGNITADPVILYLGDLDPSGEDMVRDVADRLNKFLAGYVDPSDVDQDDQEDDLDWFEHWSPSGWNVDEFGSVKVRVIKVAITPAQVQQYGPPPNPAKVTDSRAAAYIAKHGTSSWEVDALSPSVLQAIVRKALEDHLDMDLMATVKHQEAREKAQLRDAVAEILAGEEEDDDGE